MRALLHKAAAIFAAALCLAAGSAAAHDKSVSYSLWTLKGDRELVALVALSERQATLLQGGPDAPAEPAAAAAAHFAERLSARTGDARCTLVETARPIDQPKGKVAFELAYRCAAPADRALVLRSDAFFDLSAGHIHFLRFRGKGETGWREAALSTAARDFAPIADQAEGGRAGIGAFFKSGVVHVLGGLDHLAFVFAVLLGASSLRGAATAVTGFTIGHSLSLAAVIGGLVVTEPQLIEALIAFTIWLVAVEILSRESADARGPTRLALGLLAATAGAALLLGTGPPAQFWAGLLIGAGGYFALSAGGGQATSVLLGATFIFGVIHGFGFAGALQAAFPDSAIGLGGRLLAFNLGVEAGQLLFIAALVALGAALLRITAPSASHEAAPEVLSFERGLQLTRVIGAVLLCALGGYWFTDRALV